MPELPEVETIKRQLSQMITGLTIKEIEIRSSKSFVGEKKEIIGKKIKGLKRYGKMIQIEINGKKDLLVHLKMTGQLIYVTRLNGKRDKLTNLPGKSTRVIISFMDGSKLFFNDNRKFGWIKVISNLPYRASKSPLQCKQISNLGMEPFSEEYTLRNFAKILKNGKRAIKILLMDQGKIAGMGNIYTNEALFLSKIMPMRSGKSLSGREIKSLYNSILEVLNEGISHQGSSGKDKGYVNALGESGKHQNYFWVYQREGENCKRCGGAIERITLGGRGTWVCRECQR